MKMALHQIRWDCFEVGCASTYCTAFTQQACRDVELLPMWFLVIRELPNVSLTNYVVRIFSLVIKIIHPLQPVTFSLLARQILKNVIYKQQHI